MKKVGIVSCYFKNNYGSMLQAYATQEFLNKNNIDNETINITSNVDFKKGKRKYYLSQIFNYKFLKTKFGMLNLKIIKIFNKKLRNNIKTRTNKYKEFEKKFKLSKRIDNYYDLNKYANNNYSDVIVGSDQLWLPVNVVADYYTLNWVNNNINKISYSTSFGISNIEKKYDDLYFKFLSKINHLSTREESGLDIINKYNLKGKIVCDPTILLTAQEWKNISIKKRIIKDKYILCYFLGNNIEHRKYVEKIKKITGYKIVSLNHADEYVKYSDIYADIIPYDIGPKEWINLVENAEYVCTDSFHFTVFSILFNKLFFDFRRYNSKNKMSTNSRIDSLLHLAGISNNRILDCSEDVNEILKYDIDYKEVNKKIEKIRKESSKWLLDALKKEIK